MLGHFLCLNSTFCAPNCDTSSFDLPMINSQLGGLLNASRPWCMDGRGQPTAPCPPSLVSQAWTPPLPPPPSHLLPSHQWPQTANETAYYCNIHKLKALNRFALKKRQSDSSQNGPDTSPIPLLPRQAAGLVWP